MNVTLSLLRLSLLACLCGVMGSLFQANSGNSDSFLRGAYAATPEACAQSRLEISEQRVIEYVDGALTRDLDVVDYMLKISHPDGGAVSGSVVMQLISNGNYEVLHVQPESSDGSDTYRANWIRSDRRIARSALSRFVESRPSESTIVTRC